MSERNEARVVGPYWLERIAWNAAALAAIAVMLLVLLGSLEWLDRIAAPTKPVSGPAPAPTGPLAARPQPQTLACAPGPRLTPPPPRVE